MTALKAGPSFLLALALGLGAFPASANEPVSAVRYPYVAALSRTSGSERVYFCAGTLVAPRWILTAAHCFHSTSGVRIAAENLSAVVGQDRLRGRNDDVQVAVDRLFVHPGYESRSQRNDIALVRLTEIAGPLIAELGAARAARAATVLGFGSFYEGRFAATALLRSGSPAAQVSDTMSRGTVRLVEPAQCAAFGADDDMLCGASAGIDACVGDSGGPLVEEATDGPDRLIGVVSVGSGCAVRNPVVRYTRVEPYAAWIAETIQQSDDPLE